MKDIWFGLAHVVPQNNKYEILDGAKGAYVNVLALASSKDEYVKIITKTLEDYEFMVSSVEDINLLSYLQQSGREFDSEILQLVDRLSDNYPVQFDEFQSYEEDEE